MGNTDLAGARTPDRENNTGTVAGPDGPSRPGRRFLDLRAGQQGAALYIEFDDRTVRFPDSNDAFYGTYMSDSVLLGVSFGW